MTEKTEYAKKLLKKSCLYCTHVSPFNEHACLVSWEEKSKADGNKPDTVDTIVPKRDNTCKYWTRREW